MYLLLDPVNYNPLKKGSIKFLSAVSVKMVGCYDIGRAAAKLIADPDPWNGKILDVCMHELHACMYVMNTDDLNYAYKTVCLYMYVCVYVQVASWQGSGEDLAAALQKVSNTPTKFSLAMPRFLRGDSAMLTYIQYIH